MPPWPKLFLLLALLAVSAQAGNEAKSGAAKPAASLDSEKEKSAPNLDLVVPINEKVTGMHLPFYTLNGALKMQFDAGNATRVDDENLQMVKLRIETFDEQRKSEMVVDFPTAKYNLANQIISSPDVVHIKRPDFQITGKGMEFDTKNKTGRLFSQIRMEIHSRDQINPEPAHRPNGP